MDDSVNIEVDIDDELADKFNNLTKKQLIEKLFELSIELKVEKGTLKHHTKLLESLAERLNNTQAKLTKAEAYVEQGRLMIQAVMDRWYEYDV